MKIPQIEKRLVVPPILMGEIKIELRHDFLERLKNLADPYSSTAKNENQLRAYFANFLGIPIHKRTNQTSEESWVYSFTVTDISNETRADSYDFLGPIGLIPWLLFQPSVSVSIEGKLVDSKSGNTLSKATAEQSFNPRRSFFPRRVQSLPMIEVAAVSLLKELKEKVPL